MATQSTSAELILAAARRAIAAKGPGKLTLSEVAAAAGVSRPTLYRWFPTRDDLFAALTGYERAQFDDGSNGRSTPIAPRPGGWMRPCGTCSRIWTSRWAPIRSGSIPPSRSAR